MCMAITSQNHTQDYDMSYGCAFGDKLCSSARDLALAAAGRGYDTKEWQAFAPAAVLWNDHINQCKKCWDAYQHNNKKPRPGVGKMRTRRSDWWEESAEGNVAGEEFMGISL